MTPTATADKKQEPLDLDALERECVERREVLLEQQQRMSIEAIHDPRVAQEEREVVSQIEAADAELQRLRLARPERERRAVRAREDAERAAQSKAKGEADKILAQLRAKAVHLDGEAKAYAAALGEFISLFALWQETLIRAGILPYGSGRNPRGEIQAGLSHALREQDVRPIFSFDVESPTEQPLAQTLPQE